jgi:hypothetical protein
MRKLPSLTVAAAALGATLIAALPAVADAAETRRGMRNAVGDSRHPCRALALRFDNTAAKMMGGNMAAGLTDMGRMPMASGSAAMPAGSGGDRNMAAATAGGGGGMAGGGKLDQAAMTRNEGMEACNAGRIEEGMRKLNEAITGLGT